LSVISGHYRNVLIGFDRQRALLLCTTLSAVASALTTALLAGSHGAQGAVFGLLAGNAVLAASTAWAVNRGILRAGREA
jgi:O-antigen/teichoic acid export membrane protein